MLCYNVYFIQQINLLYSTSTHSRYCNLDHTIELQGQIDQNCAGERGSCSLLLTICTRWELVGLSWGSIGVEGTFMRYSYDHFKSIQRFLLKYKRLQLGPSGSLGCLGAGLTRRAGQQQSPAGAPGNNKKSTKFLRMAEFGQKSSLQQTLYSRSYLSN